MAHGSVPVRITALSPSACRVRTSSATVLQEGSVLAVLFPGELAETLLPVATMEPVPGDRAGTQHFLHFSDLGGTQRGRIEEVLSSGPASGLLEELSGCMIDSALHAQLETGNGTLLPVRLLELEAEGARVRGVLELDPTTPLILHLHNPITGRERPLRCTILHQRSIEQPSSISWEQDLGFLRLEPDDRQHLRGVSAVVERGRRQRRLRFEEQFERGGEAERSGSLTDSGPAQPEEVTAAIGTGEAEQRFPLERVVLEDFAVQGVCEPRPCLPKRRPTRKPWVLGIALLSLALSTIILSMLLLGDGEELAAHDGIRPLDMSEEGFEASGEASLLRRVRDYNDRFRGRAEQLEPVKTTTLGPVRFRVLSPEEAPRRGRLLGPTEFADRQQFLLTAGARYLEDLRRLWRLADDQAIRRMLTRKISGFERRLERLRSALSHEELL
ncbi:MAG: hypothetical protein A2284_04240 [Deltaproteobacteria bacterium RIFOXYA12_FULL_61_11]|nr:MAG: hypothetical protein A2284_04240 [Deltaproteobacteria bacterium RIFOXYA12_FULL_61_11]